MTRAGWLFRRPDLRDWRVSSLTCASSLPDLQIPSHLSVRAPRGYQGSTASCVGWALSRGIYMSLALQGQPPPEPAALWLYGIARLWQRRGLPPAGRQLVDIGCYPHDAMCAVRELGFVPEAVWPFSERQVDVAPPPVVAAKAYPQRGLRWYRVWETGAARLDVVREAMRRRGTVIYGQRVDEAFKRWNGVGRIEYIDPHNAGGHGMTVLEVEPHGVIRFDNWWANWGLPDGTGRLSPELFCDPVITPDVYVIVAAPLPH